MNRTYFPPVRTWILPEPAFRESLREMAQDGVKGNEGCVLWLGRRDASAATITHLVALRGPGVIKRPDFLRIDTWLFNEVADLAIELGLKLIGQIHTHGRAYGTDLSWADTSGGIVVPYYLSVVAPDYALYPDIRVSDCGVHVFEPGYGYQRMPAQELGTRMEMTSGPKPEWTIVGRNAQ